MIFLSQAKNKIILYLLQHTDTEFKLRLLMIYAMVYPEKFEGDKGTKLMQVAICHYYLYDFFKLKKKKVQELK